MNVTERALQGSSEMRELVGRTFEFLFHPGWEDPQWVKVALRDVLETRNEFGTPIYYLMDKDGGGYMKYETDYVVVRFD